MESGFHKRKAKKTNQKNPVLFSSTQLCLYRVGRKLTFKSCIKGSKYMANSNFTKQKRNQDNSEYK